MIFRAVSLFTLVVLVVIGAKVLGTSGVLVSSSGSDSGSGVSGSESLAGVSVVVGVTSVGVDVVFGGLTVVTTLVMTVGAGVGFVVGSAFGIGSLMIPSHSLPSAGVVGVCGVSSGVSGVSGTSGVSGVSEVSSASAGLIIAIEVTAIEPIKIRVKNNLTNRFIIF